MVSTRGRNPKRYMEAADGAQVSPTLYFRGGSGHPESPKQIELRNKVNELIEKYTKTVIDNINRTVLIKFFNVNHKIK